MYKQVDAADIEYLRSFIPAERVLTGEDIGPDYSRDELGGPEKYPDALLHVRTADEISRVMRYAHEKRIPVVARGSGTGLVGASVPIYGGIMICLSGMNKIIELDEENLTLTVEPGALLMEIAAFVEPRGLFYPPDPGEKSATIGGNIATDAGGMRAVKYGVTRDYIRGLEAALPNGEIIELGGKVAKNSSGYSLKDLIVGSEGTLAVITKAVLRLLPLPKRSLSLLIPYPDIESAVGSVVDVMMTRYVPTAVEFMENEVILDAENFLGRKFPDKQSGAYLLLTFDGNSKDELDAACQATWEVCSAKGAIDMLVVDTDERKEAVWSARGAFLEAIKASTTEMDECDVVVPKSKVADFIGYTYEIKRKHEVRIKSFGHAGDGNLHIYVLRDAMNENEWKNKLSAVFDDLYKKASEFGGKVSGEHGVGFAKLPYLARSESPQVLAIMKGVKTVFDPHNILNPGKIF